jgi:hypothetical protein
VPTSTANFKRFEVPINTRTKQFFVSEKGVLLRDELVKMTKSKQYNTKSMYSTTDKTGRTFVDKHMIYMSQYPTLNHQQYISNLRVMTRIR